MTERSILTSLLLLLGTACIVGAGVYTLAHLEDGVVFSVLVPGVVIGLLLVGAYVRTRGRNDR